VEPKHNEKTLKLASDILGDDGYADISSWENVFTMASKPPEHDFDHSDLNVRAPNSGGAHSLGLSSSSVKTSSDNRHFGISADWGHRVLYLLAGLYSNMLSVAAAVMLVASVPLARFLFGDQWRFFAPILACSCLVVWALHAASALYLVRIKQSDAAVAQISSMEPTIQSDPIKSSKTKPNKRKISSQPSHFENESIMLPQYKSYPPPADEQRPNNTSNSGSGGLGERISFRLKSFTGGSNLNVDTTSNPKSGVQAPPSASASATAQSAHSPKQTRNRFASAFQGLFKGKSTTQQAVITSNNMSPRVLDSATATAPSANIDTMAMPGRVRSTSMTSGFFFHGKDSRDSSLRLAPEKQRASLQWVSRSNIQVSKEGTRDDDQSPSPGRARGVSIPAERDSQGGDEEDLVEEDRVRSSYDCLHSDRPIFSRSEEEEDGDDLSPRTVEHS